MYDTLVLIDSVVSTQIKNVGIWQINLIDIEVVHKTTSLQGFPNLGFPVIDRLPS